MRYIDITLDKPRKLRFDINALDGLEQALNLPLGAILGLFRQGSIRAAKVAAWFGLRHEDKNLTEQKVGVILQDYLDGGGTIPELHNLIIDAIFASGVVKRDEEDPSSDPPPATTETT